MPPPVRTSGPGRWPNATTRLRAATRPGTDGGLARELGKPRPGRESGDPRRRERERDSRCQISRLLIPVNYTRNGPFGPDFALGCNLPGLSDAANWRPWRPEPMRFSSSERNWPGNATGLRLPGFAPHVDWCRKCRLRGTVGAHRCVPHAHQAKPPREGSVGVGRNWDGGAGGNAAAVREAPPDGREDGAELGRPGRARSRATAWSRILWAAWTRLRSTHPNN